MKPSSSSPSNPDFLPLFEPASIADTSTSDVIPDSFFKMGSQLKSLLAKNYPVGFALVLVETQWARICARSMLLQLFHWDPETIENNGITIYNKVQLAYNGSAQPYHWLYCEAGIDSPERWCEMLGCSSFALVVEESLLTKNQKLIESIKQSSSKLGSPQPPVYILGNREDDSSEEDLKFVNIGTSQPIDSANPELIQSLFQNGKIILSQGHPFQALQQEIPSNALSFFFDRWEAVGAKTQSREIDSVWRSALEDFREKMVEECVDSYLVKMNKLLEGKKMVPIKMIRGTHEMTLQFSLKSLQKSLLHSDQMEDKACQMINQELKSLIEAAGENNFEWGKSFLEQEYSAIHSRVKSKEIKTIQNFKQQLLIFRQFFHRKSEQLGSRKLDLYFEQFLIEKMLEGCEHIWGSEQSVLRDELQQAKAALEENQAENKQHRKTLGKRNLENMTTIQSLRQKIAYYSSKEETLEGTISQLKEELAQASSSWQLKVAEMQKRFMEQLGEIKQSNHTLSEELGQKRRQIQVLSSEIEKECLLHEQTKEHYEGLLKKQREKEEELQEKLQSLTLQSLEDNELAKQRSVRELSESAVSKANSEKQFVRMCDSLTELNESYAKLEQKYRNLEYEMQLKQSENKVIANDMAISLKMSEQKALELESRMPRYLKYEEDNEALKRTVEDLTLRHKDNEKEKALLRQELTFTQQKMSSLDIKVASLKQENTAMKQQVEVLEEKQAREVAKADEWVQTDLQSQQQQQLEEAIRLTHVIEEEYLKLKRQLKRQSRGQMFVQY